MKRRRASRKDATGFLIALIAVNLVRLGEASAYLGFRKTAKHISAAIESLPANNRRKK